MATRQQILFVRLLMASQRSFRKASLLLILPLLFNSAVPAFALKERAITERSGLEELGGALKQFAGAAGVLTQPSPLSSPTVSMVPVLWLSFNPAAGSALHNAGLEGVFQVVENPDDAFRQARLGFPPEKLIGVLTTGMEEADYTGLVPGMGFVRVQNLQPGWEAYVTEIVSSRSGGSVIPIFERSTLALGLRRMGIPGPVIQQVLAGLEEAYDTLNQMQ